MPKCKHNFTGNEDDGKECHYCGLSLATHAERNYSSLLEACKEILECHRCGELPELDSNVLKQLQQATLKAEETQ